MDMQVEDPGGPSSPGSTKKKANKNSLLANH